MPVNPVRLTDAEVRASLAQMVHACHHYAGSGHDCRGQSTEF